MNLQDLTVDEKLYIEAKATYYIGEPIMSDPDFDTLENTLRSIDSTIIDIVGIPSFTKTGKIKFKKGKLKTIDHKSPMRSLAKIKFEDDYVPFSEWLNWLPKNINESTVEFGPKLDGNAINIIYVDGNLQSITSRGDGVTGQDYTESMKHAVPNKIKDFTGEIRGEAVIDLTIFDKYYGENSNNTDKKYKNARNFVAGALTSGEKQKCENIDIVAFHIVDFNEDTQVQLIKWGFDVLDFTVKHPIKNLKTETELVDIYELFFQYRKKCKYQLDGIVAKISEENRNVLGANDHHPHWALAIKFVTEEVKTKIIDIEWTLGKNGQLSPIFVLEPVELLGSTVKRASAYNASWIINKKAFPGATVSLIKSGDIIPKIVEVITEAP